jgi:hypothetical protein
MDESYEVGQELYRGEICGSHVGFESFAVSRVTPKGAWIVQQWEWEKDLADTRHPLHQLAAVKEWSWTKWIPHEAKFASTTREAAFGRLTARCRSYVRHCSRRLKEAERRVRVVAKVRDENHPYDENTRGEDPWDGQIKLSLSYGWARR